jgi:hypothetical protein
VLQNAGSSWQLLVSILINHIVNRHRGIRHPDGTCAPEMLMA